MLVVVLATYRGERHLPEFLASLRKQTLVDWRLVVRDDGSPDDTVGVVRRAAAVDSRIELVADDRGRLGPAGSFGVLLETAASRGARYVALADQDDVWLPGKLARSLAAMRSVESRAGTARPVLVHTDLAVVDDRLRPRHPSLVRLQRLEVGHARALASLLFHNRVTGCTVLANRALLERALPIPAAAEMHDWWLALCAAACGDLVYLDEPTILYRQHGDNAVGSQSPWRRLSALFDPRRRTGLLEIRGVLAQAAALRDRFGVADEVPAEHRELLSEVTRIFARSCSGLSRIAALARLGLPDANLGRRLLTYARVLRLGSRCPVLAADSRAAASDPLRRAA